MITYKDLNDNQKHLLVPAFNRYKKDRGFNKRGLPPLVFDLDFDIEQDRKLENDFNWLIDNGLIHVEGDYKNKVSYCLSNDGLKLMLQENSL
jgi:hypothetical protein